MFRNVHRVAVSLAIAIFCAIGINTSRGQPELPEPPDDASGSVQREAPAEPGYLGLVGDERQDAGSGVRVVRVIDGTPAAKAGLAVNDLIVAIDGNPVDSIAAMAAQLRPKAAGRRVRFEVRRGDARQEIEVTLGHRPPPDDRPFDFGRIPDERAEPSGASPPAATAPPATDSLPSMPDGVPPPLPRGQLLGIRTGVVPDEMAQRLRLPKPGGARVVSRVVGSPADLAGIPLESIIVAVDDQPVASPTDLARLIRAAGPANEVVLTYFADGQQRKVRVLLAGVPPPVVAGDGRPARAEGVIKPIDPAAERSILIQRIDELEQRIRELEQRVKMLEGARSTPPAEPAASSRQK
jgi:S1-C subfamily serine protease